MKGRRPLIPVALIATTLVTPAAPMWASPSSRARRPPLARHFEPSRPASAFAEAAADRRSLGGGWTAGPSQAPHRSVWDGVYTDAQAKRGGAAYEYSCSTC